MSREAVELVRRGYEAYESDGIEGVLRFLDRSVEWRNPPDSPIAAFSTVTMECESGSA